MSFSSCSLHQKKPFNLLGSLISDWNNHFKLQIDQMEDDLEMELELAEEFNAASAGDDNRKVDDEMELTQPAAS